MARLPIYEQQTSAKAGRVTPQEMGAGTGQALGQMGSVVADIGMNMKRREDTLDRVRLFGEFDTFAQQSFEALAPEDIVNKDTFEKYQTGLKEKAQELLGAHSGTGDSRAEFQAQLENQTTQYQKMAMGQRVKAGLQMVGGMVDRYSNELANKGSFAPQEMNNLFADYDNWMEGIRDAVPAGQYEEWRTAGRSKIATNTIKSLMTQGNDTAAEMLMKDPNVGTYLDSNTARSFSIEIAVNKGKQEAEVARQDANVRKFTTLLGDLTPDEVARVRALPEKKDMTPVDEIIQLELVKRRSATQDEVDKIFGTYVDKGGVGKVFGSSIEGLSLDIVTRDAVKYANGLMGPDEARYYEAAYNRLKSPMKKQNPVTGMLEDFYVSPPDFAEQAMAQGRQYYSGSSNVAQIGVSGDQVTGPRTAVPGQQVRVTDNGQVMGVTTTQPNGTWSMTVPPSGAAGQSPSGGAQMTPTISSLPPNEGINAPPPTPVRQSMGRTIWDRRKNIAGPLPGVISAIRGMEYIGPAVTDAILGEEVTRQADQDRIYVEGTTKDLVNVLRRNPRFAEGERQAIEKEISISPEFFTSVEKYEGRLKGINEQLQDRYIDAQRILTSNPTLELKKYANDAIIAIELFREKLGIPVPVRTEQEVQQLKPGTRFITPDGQELTKR